MSCRQHQPRDIPWTSRDVRLLRICILVLAISCTLFGASVTLAIIYLP